MSYRKIETRRDASAPSMPEEARPELRWLPIDRLVIDDGYQRPLGKANWQQIDRIARAFTWSRFTPCLAAPLEEPGWWALIDGQHRTHAALAVGHLEVPAMVVPLDARAQAAAFAWVNGEVTAVTQFQVLKAALAAGEGWAVDCRRAVEEGGGVLMTYPKGPGDKRAGEIFSIALVRNHVQAGRAALVTHVLRSLRTSSIGEDARYWQHNFLSSLMVAVQVRPAAMTCDLARFLSEADFKRMFRGVERLLDDPRFQRQSRQALTRRALGVILDRWLADAAKRTAA